MTSSTPKIQKTEAEWKAVLAEKGAEPVAFQVTRHAATERPFTGKYEAHWDDGTYHCVCCGAKLFESGTKFDAGCGWPSFSEEAVPGAITNIVDRSHGMTRTENVCTNCGAHLGHVFEGEYLTPKNTRHCVNSLSMKFVPKEG